MKPETKAKKEQLIALSLKAKDLRDEFTEQADTEADAFYWASRTVNFMLLYHVYETGGAQEFNTFKQWKEKGATVKKGEKAFLVWGQPVSKQRQEDKEQPGEQEEEEDYSFFPVCYLFSEHQVNTAEEIAAEKQRIQEQQAEKEAKAQARANAEAVQLDEVIF